MAGRKPKPTYLKLLQGNPGKRELPKNEPKPPKAKGCVPMAPRHLTEPAKRQWRVVAKQLAGANMLTELDVHALALYCEAYVRYRVANVQIEKFGAVVKAPSGWPVQSPFLAIANKALEQMTKLMIEFGMTPSSRSRVHAICPEKEVDPMDAFLARRAG